MDSLKRRPESINSLDSVMDGLQFLDMPIPSQTAINLLFSSEEKGTFIAALEDCLQLNGTSPSKETKRYLFGLVSCVSDVIIQALSKLEYHDIPLKVLIEIGRKNGMAFRAAINAALTPHDPNHEISFDMVNMNIVEAYNTLGIKISGKTSLPKLASPSVPEDHSRPNPKEEPNITEDYLSTHVYGKTAALCFNAAQSKRKNEVVMIDAAVAIGDRQYDWKRAITIQLGHKELPLLFGVITGWKNSIKFGSHGETNDKSMEIVRQEGKLYVTVAAKRENVRGVQITEMDAYYVSSVVLSQIVRQAPPELRSKPELIIQLMKSTQNIMPVGI